MSPYQMSDQQMAQAAALAQRGSSLEEIASRMRISLAMADTAVRKWPLIQRLKQNQSL